MVDILLENYKHFYKLKALSIFPVNNLTNIRKVSPILKAYILSWTATYTPKGAIALSQSTGMKLIGLDWRKL
ncbi:hypothetical protein [Nostoc sp.]|uniref:hypothetical protein n=1 Tax=Nostoc sp. TaxID=1180 RepID=UPI002FFB016B